MRFAKTAASIGLVAASLAVGYAQTPAGNEPKPSTTDPRANLKPGFRDAQVAAWNLDLVATLPKPEGFFDPSAPAGPISQPEQPDDAPGQPPQRDPNAPPGPPPGVSQPGGVGPPPPPPGAGFTNSDLAFAGNHVIAGNYHGFNTYNIERADRPRLIASVVCPGGQGDVSIWGNLLFMSAQETRGRLDCGLQGVQAPVSAERFRGVRIFDITDLTKPRQVAAVQTCRGSHTHTLVPDVKDKSRIYVYNSGTGAVRPGEELAGCSGKQDDPNTSLFSIDVIEVPLAAPQNARIVNQPRIFMDDKSGALGGLWQGGNHGPGTQTSRLTTQCHDITVYSEIGLAAGACAGNGILMDISDPRNPKRLDFVTDKSFAYWHSATFNNDGTKIVFTDEWGGGSRPRCRATDPLTWGADAIFDIVDKKLVFRGYFKMPAAQGEQENCVAHNGSLIPVPGRDIMVQAWYQGGLSMFDFTDSANAKEIAYFDRGPLNGQNLVLSGYWSTYWYNGNIYGAEIARGIDVFRLKPSEFLSQNEIDAALQFRLNEFNSQNQPRVSWPATSAVAKAYLDQLGRTNAIAPERASAVRNALGRVDELRTGKERDAAARLEALTALASQVEADAKSRTGRDAMRLNALAGTLRGRAASMR
jgi:hypothetical protein